jgi:hypothetical protein
MLTRLITYLLIRADVMWFEQKDYIRLQATMWNCCVRNRDVDGLRQAPSELKYFFVRSIRIKTGFESAQDGLFVTSNDTSMNDYHTLQRPK